MGNSKIVKHYKYKNIAAALAVLLFVLVAASSALTSDKKPQTKTPDNSSSSSLESSVKKNSSSKAKDNALKLTENYKYETVKNGTELSTGNLVLVNDKHKFTGEPKDLDSVYSYLFNKSGEQIMSTSSTNLYAVKECFSRFNLLVSDFYKNTKLKTLMISDALYIDENSEEQSDENSSLESMSVPTENGCYEHDTGLALDLHLYDADEGKYPVFTGSDKYSWISENCWKYGFILRYPADKKDVTGVSGLANHFRYVGKISAQIMHEKNLILEEYLDFVKDYSFEKPYSLRGQNGAVYAVYYVSADKGTTTNVPVPLKKDGTEYSYELSGNNVDGYIVIAEIITGADEGTASDDASTQKETA